MAKALPAGDVLLNDLFSRALRRADSFISVSKCDHFMLHLPYRGDELADFLDSCFHRRFMTSLGEHGFYEVAIFTEPVKRGRLFLLLSRTLSAFTIDNSRAVQRSGPLGAGLLEPFSCYSVLSNTLLVEKSGFYTNGFAPSEIANATGVEWLASYCAIRDGYYDSTSKAFTAYPSEHFAHAKCSRYGLWCRGPSALGQQNLGPPSPSGGRPPLGTYKVHPYRMVNVLNSEMSILGDGSRSAGPRPKDQMLKEDRDDAENRQDPTVSAFISEQNMPHKMPHESSFALKIAESSYSHLLPARDVSTAHVPVLPWSLSNREDRFPSSSPAVPLSPRHSDDASQQRIQAVNKGPIKHQEDTKQSDYLHTFSAPAKSESQQNNSSTPTLVVPPTTKHFHLSSENLKALMGKQYLEPVLDDQGVQDGTRYGQTAALGSDSESSSKGLVEIEAPEVKGQNNESGLEESNADDSDLYEGNVSSDVVKQKSMRQLKKKAYQKRLKAQKKSTFNN